ncbi:MAG: hypothetical protein AAF903_09220 [Pseudomonadota bacterium]
MSLKLLGLGSLFDRATAEDSSCDLVNGAFEDDKQTHASNHSPFDAMSRALKAQQKKVGELKEAALVTSDPAKREEIRTRLQTLASHCKFLEEQLNEAGHSTGGQSLVLS